MHDMHEQSQKEQHFLRAIFRAIRVHPLQAIFILAIDAAFLAAVLGIDSLINTAALALGIPAISTAILPILLLLVYAILLILVITIAKDLHLRAARKMLGGPLHRISIPELFTFSTISTVLVLGAYFILGKLFSSLNGQGGLQTLVLTVFFLILLFMLLLIYPSQWQLAQGKKSAQAYHQGFKTFRKPAGHARIVIFIVVCELVVFMLYSVAVMVFHAHAQSLGPTEFVDAYAAFIKTSTASFIILTYLVFYLTRLLLYEHTIALAQPEPAPTRAQPTAAKAPRPRARRAHAQAKKP